MSDNFGKVGDAADVDGRVHAQLRFIGEGISGGSSNNTYQSAVVDLAAATDNQELIAAPSAGNQIKVYGLHISSAGAGSIELQDEDDVKHTGIIPVGTNGGFIWPVAPSTTPWITVAAAKALDAKTVGAGATMDGVIVYAVVPV